MRPVIAALSLLLCIVTLPAPDATVLAQDPPPDRNRPDRPGGDRRGRGGPMRGTLEIAEQFDADGNGMLDAKERAAARAHVKEVRSRDGRGRRGFGRRRPGGDAEPFVPKPGPRVTPEEVRSYPDRDFYDPKVLRTFFIDFEAVDWEAELADFYRTDVEVPARLTVDGEVYENVGIRFRGNSSFFSVSPGLKRSLNVSLNAVDSEQRLHGYRTVNLLNAHTDPSFLREVLFGVVARSYLPSLNANLAKVVINGESWGVYVNAQQFNSDFISEWFDTRGGARWKVPPNMRGGSALVDAGDDVAVYKERYQIKSRDRDEAWADLMALTKKLESLPDEALETELEAIFNIDRALWFLAVDNVLIDGDGYFSRGSDYALYQDPGRRFHMIPIDSNETFRNAGGGRGGRGRGGPPRGTPGGERQRPPSGPTLSPVEHEASDTRPVIRRLLGHPPTRARYLAHVRTIVDEWLQWDRVGPIVSDFHELIADEVDADVKKLVSQEAFLGSATGPGSSSGRRRTPSLRGFIDGRREFLEAHAELAKPSPEIISVRTLVRDRDAGIDPTKPVTVILTVTKESAVATAHLYYSTDRIGPFTRLVMERVIDGEDHAYSAVIPAQAAGTTVRYYAEARSPADVGTTRFHPRSTEVGALSYEVALPVSDGTAVVINEVMASNSTTIADEDGDFDDWVELHNRSSTPADLTGMYLSDDKRNLRKWAFPAGTVIPGNGYLLVWADGTPDSTGLHASFKVSAKGETLLLCDRDSRGNAVLDLIRFRQVPRDRSIGRVGTSEELRLLVPTPGKPNIQETSL